MLNAVGLWIFTERGLITLIRERVQEVKSTDTQAPPKPNQCRSRSCQWHHWYSNLPRNISSQQIEEHICWDAEELVGVCEGAEITAVLGDKEALAFWMDVHKV